MLERNKSKILKEIIDNIVKSTQTILDQDFDETATKQFVVMPILRALGWDDSNLETLEVLPEIPTDPESGKQIKVDYALRHEGKVLVMIECKRWRENLEKLEHHEQLAGYIFQRGVDIGVLTNGKTWHFYFAYKTHVPWRKRKFFSIELNNQQETVVDFQKYLSKDKVIDGSAKTEAEKIVSKQLDIQWDPEPPSLEGSEKVIREDT